MPTPSDPTTGSTGQSSSRGSGDPKVLRQEQDTSEEAFEDLQNYLMTGCKTPGSRIDHTVGSDEEKDEQEY